MDFRIFLNFRSVGPIFSFIHPETSTCGRMPLRHYFHNMRVSIFSYLSPCAAVHFPALRQADATLGLAGSQPWCGISGQALLRGEILMGKSTLGMSISILKQTQVLWTTSVMAASRSDARAARSLALFVNSICDRLARNGADPLFRPQSHYSQSGAALRLLTRTAPLALVRACAPRSPLAFSVF